MLAFEKKLANAKITCVSSGENALDFIFCMGKFKNWNKLNLPDLILLDINLPKMSGIEVLKILKSDVSVKSIPVIVLTSSGEEKDINDCFREGANSYIRKPVDFKEFMMITEKIGEYWFSLNELLVRSRKKKMQ